MVPMLMANAPAGHIAMTFGLTGANFATISACSSSNHAIFEAMRLLRDGTLDLCIAGGSESATLPLTVAAFSQMTALTKNPDPDVASRPFDAQRDGFVLSEGACALIMETEEHAKARGARIYCEVAGAGASDDAFHITAPDPKGSGAVLAMRWALQDAGAEPNEVDYINAHGTSTPLNDASEAAAITEVLGDHATSVAISSTKSMTGHQMGAAGAVEGAACALAITHGAIPPTIHYSTPDPGFELDVTPNTARELDVRLRALELVRLRRPQHVRRVPRVRLNVPQRAVASLIALVVAALPASDASAGAIEACAGYGAVRVTGAVTIDGIDEVSGVVASRHRPVLWIEEDSGNPERIYAIGPGGAERSTVGVTNADNWDWEDIALTGRRIWLADIGDNLQIRASIQVYWFREPRPTDTSVAARVLELTYEDGPHNAEAMVVDGKQRALFVFTKQAGTTSVYTTSVRGIQGGESRTLTRSPSSR